MVSPVEVLSGDLSLSLSDGEVPSQEYYRSFAVRDLRQASGQAGLHCAPAAEYLAKSIVSIAAAEELEQNCHGSLVAWHRL